MRFLVKIRVLYMQILVKTWSKIALTICKFRSKFALFYRECMFNFVCKRSDRLCLKVNRYFNLLILSISIESDYSSIYKQSISPKLPTKSVLMIFLKIPTKSNKLHI